MTWRIAVVPDAVSNGVAIQIARRMGDGHFQQLRFEQAAEAVLTPPGAAMPMPSLVLADDLAMDLLDALADHYGSTSGGRQQRGDFEHERARVDGLIGVLGRLAEGAVTAALQPPADLHGESRPQRRRVVESPDIPGRDKQPGGLR